MQKAELDRDDLLSKLAECRQQLEHTETAKMELTGRIQMLQSLAETHVFLHRNIEASAIDIDACELDASVCMRYGQEFRNFDLISCTAIAGMHQRQKETS